MSSVLSEDVSPEAFAREGYCLLRNAIPAPTLARLAGFCRSHNTASAQVAAREALPAQLEPAIMGLVSAILGEMPLPLATGFFRVAPSRVPNEYESPLNPHTHNLELVTEPPGGFVFVWLALQDIKLSDGPMWIMPRSHQQMQTLQLRLHEALSRTDPDYLNALQRGFANGPTESDLQRLLAPYHNALRRILSMEIAEIVPVLIQAGDALVFDAALLHGTMQPVLCGDGGKPLRLACATRYVGSTRTLYTNVPWAREAVPDPAYRLFCRVVETPFGRVCEDYTSTRLRRLNVA